MINPIPAPVPGYRYSQDGDPVHAWWEPARPYPFRPCLDIAGPGKCRRAGGRVITDHPADFPGMLTAWPEDPRAAHLFDEGAMWVIRLSLKSPWVVVKLDTPDHARTVRGLHAEGLAFHAYDVPPGSFTEKGSRAGGMLPPRPTRPSPVGLETVKKRIDAERTIYDNSFLGAKIPLERGHHKPFSVRMTDSSLAWAKGIGVSAPPVNDPALTVDEQWGEEFEL